MVGQVEVLLLNVLDGGETTGVLFANEAGDLQRLAVGGQHQQVRLKDDSGLEAAAVHLDEEQIKGGNQATVLVQDFGLFGTWYVLAT